MAEVELAGGEEDEEGDGATRQHHFQVANALAFALLNLSVLAMNQSINLYVCMPTLM